MSTSTIYLLPPGTHSVSARGLSFTGNERGEIDLIHVPSDVVTDLLAYAGVKHAPTKEELAERAAAEAEIERHQAEVAAAALAAHVDAGAAGRAAKAAEEQAAKAAELAREAEAQAVAQRAAFIAEAPVEPVFVAEEAVAEAAAPLDPNSRSVTPPRRKKA